MEDNTKLLLQRLAEDDKTLEAIREVLLEQTNVKPNLSLSNELLGAEIRAAEIAKQIVTEGLRNIKKLKIITRSEQSDKNPGR